MRNVVGYVSYLDDFLAHSFSLSVFRPCPPSTYNMTLFGENTHHLLEAKTSK